MYVFFLTENHEEHEKKRMSCIPVQQRLTLNFKNCGELLHRDNSHSQGQNHSRKK